jgi:hypothetical protein
MKDMMPFFRKLAVTGNQIFYVQKGPKFLTFITFSKFLNEAAFIRKKNWNFLRVISI